MLEPELELSIGCKLMVLENVWTERGIVNGTQCRLYDIVWAESSNPMSDPPDQLFCLLVAVSRQDYHGPKVEEFTWRDCECAVVPLYRSQRDFYYNGEMRYRQQFPVRLAYAITIHKSQGMTMPRAVLDFSIGRQEMSLFYVGASRVRRLQDLMFEQAFEYSRVSKPEDLNAIMRRQDWNRRALQRLTSSNIASSAMFRRTQSSR